MIYKDFIAEASAKIMAQAVSSRGEYDWANDKVSLQQCARNSVLAAKTLAEELEADFQNVKPDGGTKRFSEKDTFFDNYVNWTKNL